MNPFRIVIDKLFDREENDEANPQWSRVSCEIKSSIFVLMALFELIAFTSYLKIDTLLISQRHFEGVTNLGGIVGALLAEWTLGNVGILGYSLFLLTLYLAYASYRGRPFSDFYLKSAGIALSSILGAIACYLIFKDQYPETAILRGGWVGEVVGEVFEHYLNTTGSLLLVFGALFITLLLSTEVSLAAVARKLFGEAETLDEDEEETEEEEPAEQTKRSSTKSAKKTSTPTLTIAPQVQKPKRRRKKDPTPDLDATENTEEQTPNPDSEEDAPKNEGGFSELIPVTSAYRAPSPRILKNYASGWSGRTSKGEIKRKAKKLCEHLLSFQVTGEIVSVSEGPVLTTYEFKPDAGIKLKAIAALQDDLGIVLGTRELRIIAPIPGKTVVGIEIPRKQIQTIGIKELVSSKAFEDKKNVLPMAIGKSTDGEPVFADMTKLPHLLVAGATGSGKSVFINTTIMGFIFRMSPQDLRLILIDPKMLELNMFNGLPHLVSEVITDCSQAGRALSWAVQEMERRYQLMAETGSKNIDSYNSKQRQATKHLPYLVIVVDELADLMMTAGEEVEMSITRLAQKARAAGIHLIIATQRPSTEVITGLIKANIPSRISFKVPSSVDSRTILDSSGAEELIGRGDMLMVQPAVPMRRLHAGFVTEDEIQRVVKSIISGKNYKKFYTEF